MPADRPVSLRDLDVERHLGDPAIRQAYVTPMFDLIAPRYDDFTRVFSFGMDQGWKAKVIDMAAAAIPRDGVVADIATGTGDLAYALSARRPDVRITATDVSTRMLALASARGRHVGLAGGDISALPFPTASIDGVTAGYALRNTPDWRGSLTELARVIKPGGHLFTLDFYLPQSRPWRAMFLGWLSVAGRVVGWWWHREPMAYGYIAHSIAHFTTSGDFESALQRAGFAIVATDQRLGGGVVLHHAQRRQVETAVD